MKSFKVLSFVSFVALAGAFTLQAPSANAAEAISAPAVTSAAPSAVEPSYYYYRGHPYSYRYHGMYFNHRYYRGGRYRYY